MLAQGAQVFGFGVADPPFAGHELCSADPYVQGPGDPAPLHPTAAGELAIALADQQALPKAENLVPAPRRAPAARTDSRAINADRLRRITPQRRDDLRP